MTKELTKEKTDKYDKILKDSSIAKETKNLSKNELKEIKAYSIKNKLKLKRYVRN